ncbi:MAG: choice-of-anchor L domain-containing protein [Saprospiraceae bacterium]|nr:choice-of-anchor L domain-containing protein [Saprospiraceae bacterium]
MIAKWSLWLSLSVFSPWMQPSGERPSPGASGNRLAQMQPIVVVPNNDAEYLVEDVFVGSSCFGVSGMTVNGFPNQIGVFSQGGASVGIESGIILSSGNINDAVGPNELTNTTTGYGTQINDPDLVALSGGLGIYDPVSIEFDFTPSVNRISFRYVFASEEYCEFADSPFNDVFGFFLSGPGINGPYTNNAENIATLPGTDTYVGIATVNHFNNSQYYRNNIPAGVSPGCNNSPGLFTAFLEYDGLTTVLSAEAEVIPCETYHIKIILADKAEDTYDSAVFLGMSSFDAGAGVTVSAGIAGPGPDSITVYEGCADGFFRFERLGADLSEPHVIQIALHPSSTATPGVDFAPLPPTVTIPAGQTGVALPVTIFGDALTEGIETIRISLQNACSCQPIFADIRIADPLLLFVALSDTLVCAGQPLTLTPTVTGGIPDHTYLWSTGATTPQLNIPAAANSSYSLTVTDACGQAVSRTVSVTTFTPTAFLSGSDYICNGHEEALLQVSFTGPGPWTFRYSHNGLPTTLSEVTQNPFPLTVQRAGAYQLLSMSGQSCAGTVSGIATVDSVVIAVSSLATQPSCAGYADGAVELAVSGGQAPYSFVWNPATFGAQSAQGLAAGIYRISLEDAGGCRAEMEVTLSDPPPLTADVSVIQPPCHGDAGAIEIWHIGGGVFPLEYSIDGGRNFVPEAIFDSLAPGMYDIVVADARNCSFSAQATVIEPPEPAISLPALLSGVIGERIRLRPVLNVPPDEIAEIRWSPAEGLSCADCLEPELQFLNSGAYTLHITTLNGCTAEAGITIGVDRNIPVFIPNVFTPQNGDGINDGFTVFTRPESVSSIQLLRIFDRWGGMVFEQRFFQPNEVKLGWDGTHKGRPVSPGVYVYRVEVELINGAVVQLQGEVTVLR